MNGALLKMQWPPSVNRYWRSVNGRVLISKEGRTYRTNTMCTALEIGWPKFGEKRLAVSIQAFPPDRRRRDLDNILKAVLDALEAAGVYENDSQVDSLTITRMEPVKGGELLVRLEAR